MYYGGPVSHPQNRCLFTLFELETLLKPVPDKLVKEDGDVWVLLDSNAINDRRISTDLSQGVDIVVDHHREDAIEDAPENRIILIESVGSACTLVTELFSAEDLSEIAVNDTYNALTLAAIGIRNDTHNFTSELTQQRDLTAFGLLMPYIDQTLVSQSENYPLERRYYEIMQEILNSIELNDSCVVASAAFIKESDGDQLSDAAKLLIRGTQITLAVVWGVVQEKSLIRLSFRSSNPSFNLDAKIKQVFSQGGAKQSRAYGEGGARMEIGDLAILNDDPEYKESLLRTISLQVEQRVSQMINEN